MLVERYELNLIDIEPLPSVTNKKITMTEEEYLNQNNIKNPDLFFVRRCYGIKEGEYYNDQPKTYFIEILLEAIRKNSPIPFKGIVSGKIHQFELDLCIIFERSQYLMVNQNNIFSSTDGMEMFMMDKIKDNYLNYLESKGDICYYSDDEWEYLDYNVELEDE